MAVASHAEPFFSDGSPEPGGQRTGGRVGVLLLHGFAGSPASMVPWARHVAGHGYAVAVPRLPGHGTSWREMNRTGWEDWYGEAERAFEKLRASCDRVVAGGLSMGGALSLRLAEDRGDEVAGVVLVNPALTNDSPLRHLRHVLKHVVPAIGGVTNNIKKPGQDEYGYDRTPTKAAASMIDAWRNVVDDLPKVTQPVLMFRSTVDAVVPPTSGELVRERVSSRVLEERMLENSYHVATLDNDAPAIFAESVEFVRRVTGP